MQGDTRVDADLVVAAKEGDRAAMDELVAAYLPMVYNVVRRALRDHADVDDVVQETMIRMVHGLPGLRDPERFRPWLMTIAIRQIQERSRARRAGRATSTLLISADEMADMESDFADLTVERLHLSGQRREVAEAAGWLSQADRELLSLWWLEVAGRLSRADLARALELSRPHAAVRIQRMKAQLHNARSTIRALSATPRCPELDQVAERFDGQPSTLWLKRFARHIRGCPICGRYSSGMAPADRLLAGAPLLPVPIGLLPLAKLGAAASGTAHAAVLPTVVKASAGPIARLLRFLIAKPVAAATVGVVVVAGGVGVGYMENGRPAAPVVRQPVITSVTPSSIPQPGHVPTSSAGSPAAIVTGVTRADIYVAPDGNDAGPGSAARPYATLAKAASVVKAGQTIALRGGVYKPTSETKIRTDGTAAKRIVVTNYGTERPVLDGSALPGGTWLARVTASYLTVQGLEIRNVPGKAIVCLSCRYDVFDRLSVHDNLDTGLDLLQDKTIGNQILDSDFYRNHDDATAGRNADGIGIKFGSGTANVVMNCRLYDNSDDGLDLWGFTGAVTVTGTWAWGNGVNRSGIADWHGDGAGFRLGGAGANAAHIVRDDAAWDNAGNGFDGVDNAGTPALSNDTAFRNAKTGFLFKDGTAVLNLDIASANGVAVSLGSGVTTSGDSWGGSAGFASTAADTARGPRQGDGTLPATRFLVAIGAGASMREQ